MLNGTFLAKKARKKGEKKSQAKQSTNLKVQHVVQDRDTSQKLKNKDR